MERLHASLNFRLGRHSLHAAAVIALLLSLLILPGCGFLLGVASSLGYCDLPGACGASGRLMRSSQTGVSEFVEPSRAEPFLFRIDGGASGITFVENPPDLDLYVRTEFGLARFDGRVPDILIDEFEISDCGRRGDVVLMDDGDLLVSCTDAGRIVRLDPGTGQERATFSCCEEGNGPPDPFALALSPGGVVLAGTSTIYALSSATGDALEVAVKPGVEGATSYNDFLFGPDGNLYVSANPDVGVLKFDGSSFELVGVLITPDRDGVLQPGALAFNENGELYVGRQVGPSLRVFDAQDGELLREPIEPIEFGHSFEFLVFRP